MKTYSSSLLRQIGVTLLLFPALLGSSGRLAAQTPAPAATQALEASLPPGVEDVVKLTRAGLNEDVILAEVKSSGSAYQLSGDQIIFLTNAGVSQNVIKALITGTAPAAPTAQTQSTPAANPPAPAYPMPPQAQLPQPAQPPVPALLVTRVVQARIPWQDSGVDLFQGETVEITATGRAAYGRRERDRVLPQGNPSVFNEPGLLAPELTPESLVGKIGAFGAPFEIGAGIRFTSPGGGRLYLSMNDNNFSDNSGSWTVTIAGLPAAPPVADLSPPVQVSFDYFHDQLASYGNWVQLAGYGWCWSPAAAVADAGWRPYSDQGHWVYTDTGWFWQSQYAWGDIVFHYGRWYRDLRYGWLWVPDYTWAPSWVAWRDAEADGDLGWAPLPPGTRFVEGQGIYFHGQLAFDSDFGLPEDAFIFVGFDHFWDGGYRAFALPRDRVDFVFRRSAVRNGYRIEGGRLVVDGLGRDRIGRFTHREVRAADVHKMRADEERVHVQARRSKAPVIQR